MAEQKIKIAAANTGTRHKPLSGNVLKSPLRYPGGKSRAVNLISSLIPEFQEYREPFVGGGSVFVHLKQKFPDKKFRVNDIYEELYRFWEMCQLDVDALIKLVY